jgi:hypothetical protein
VEIWRDEALTLEWEWYAVTAAHVRAYTRSFSVENGIPPFEPGVQLGEWSSTAASNLTVQLDATHVAIGVGTNTVIEALHGLSPFAWRHGLCLGVQAETCPAPVEYRLDQVRLAPVAPR